LSETITKIAKIIIRII